jgi:hypothetical protein
LAPESGGPDAEALGMLKTAIKVELRIARRGLTERRKTDAAAARSAGIGVLAEAIRAATGRRHRGVVAGLAGAVFDAEVTIDMVRHAMTPAARRELWRWPPGTRWRPISARSAPKKVPERAA